MTKFHIDIHILIHPSLPPHQPSERFCPLVTESSPIAGWRVRVANVAPQHGRRNPTHNPTQTRLRWPPSTTTAPCPALAWLARSGRSPTKRTNVCTPAERDAPSLPARAVRRARFLSCFFTPAAWLGLFGLASGPGLVAATAAQNPPPLVSCSCLDFAAPRHARPGQSGPGQ